MTARPSWLTVAVALRREHLFTGSCWDAARDVNEAIMATAEILGDAETMEDLRLSDLQPDADAVDFEEIRRVRDTSPGAEE